MRADHLGALPLESLKARLNVSGEGLISEDAQSRLRQYGPNELPEEKVNPLLKFLSYFWGPIPWMIEAAVILPLVGTGRTSSLFSFCFLTNAVVGFWEEYQAGNAIAALKATLALHARVKRDGDGQPSRRANWSRATSSMSGSATLSPRMLDCSMAIPWRWISRP